MQNVSGANTQIKQQTYGVRDQISTGQQSEHEE